MTRTLPPCPGIRDEGGRKFGCDALPSGVPWRADVLSGGGGHAA